MVKLRAADQAVSPVIATILMVVTTAAMTGAAFLLLKELDDHEGRPDARFAQLPDEDRVLVVDAPPDLDWSHIKAYHSGCGVPLLNGAGAILTNSHVSSKAPVDAGDYIQVAPGKGGCKITLAHAESNSLLGTWAFD